MNHKMDNRLAPSSSMDAGSSPASSQDDATGKILEDYLCQMENGAAPSIETLVATHPELADSLRPALEKLQQLDLLARKPLHRPLSDGCAVGEVIGDFQIVAELARGGMGIVYEARQLSLQRTVALKVLPFGYLSNDQQVARFRNESRAAAMLEHPHIVPVYSIGMERGVHFYAMQLIHGCSLADAIQAMPEAERLDELPTATPSEQARQFLQHLQETPLPDATDTHHDTSSSLSQRPDSPSPTDAPSVEPTKEYLRKIAQLGIELADALAHAHQRGVIHRDIKPANILVDEHDKPWITDFGLARVRQNGTMTATGAVVGTLRYMSPEQASGRPTVDERSDIYSLGATLYELMLRRPLFPHADSHLLLNCILHDTPLKPTRCFRWFPRDLETILLKCLEKRPDDRYSSAEELQVDLRRWLQRRPIVSRRPNVVEHLSKWVSRNPTLAMLTTSIVILALTLGVGAIWYESRLQIAATQLESSDLTLQLQRQYTLRTQATRLAMDRPYGWRTQALQAIHDANAIGSDHGDHESIRTQMAALLTAIDVEPAGSLKHQDIVYALDVDEVNQKLAVGYNLVEGRVPVEIWNTVDRKLERTLYFPADLNYVTTRGVRADGVRCLSFSPKGKLLAVGTRSGWIHVFDMTKADPERVSWQASPSPLKQIRYSYVADSLYSASDNGTLTRWSVAEHRVLAQRDFHMELTDFHIAGDSVYCATTQGYRRVHANRLIDYKTSFNGPAKLSLMSPTRWYTMIASEGGKLLQTDNSGNVVRELTSSSGRPAHEDLIRSLTIHPDGGLIATTCNRQTLKLWDASSGQCIRTIDLGTTGRLHAAFVNRDFLAVTVDRETRLFKIGGKEFHGSVGAGVVRHETFGENWRSSENILSLAPAVAPNSTWHLRRWHPTNKWYSSVRRHIPYDDVILCIDNDIALATNNSDDEKGGIGIFAGSKRVKKLECSNVRAMEECQDRTQVWAACANAGKLSQERTGGIRGWNRTDWSSCGEWSNESALAQSNITTMCSLATSARWVVGGGEDGTIVVLQRSPFEFKHQCPADISRVRAVAFTPDERFVLAGGDTGELVFLDPENGQIVRRLQAHPSGISSIAVCRKAPLVVTGSGDGELRVWKYDAKTSELTRFFDLPRQMAAIVRCRFTGDSLTLISLARNDQQIHTWHLQPILEAFEADLGAHGF